LLGLRNTKIGIDDALPVRRGGRLNLLFLLIFFLIFRSLSSVFLDQKPISQSSDERNDDLSEDPREGEYGDDEKNEGDDQSGKIILFELVRKEDFRWKLLGFVDKPVLLLGLGWSLDSDVSNYVKE
jgi:hypothetical protein